MKYLIAIGIVSLCLIACYKGDPGYGNTDYPPKVIVDAGQDG